MEVSTIDVTPEQAMEAYKLYRQHVNAPGSIDWEIETIYRQIARGKKVINAFESIRQVGPDERGRPKLAIIRADAKECYFRPGWRVNNSIMFAFDRTFRKVPIEITSWPHQRDSREWGARAIVPHIPVHLRPKADLANYHILWEADWTDVPVDPMLLKRIGKTDAWIVLAAWDLTAVERTVLRSHTQRQQ